MKRTILLTASAAALLCPLSPAIAQADAVRTSGSSNILEEIIVTGARRRTEDVQEVPLAVTALNSAILERNQVTNVTDLGRLAPGLVIVRQLATPAQASIYLRGFGSESNAPAIDPPIAVYVDGIYMPQSSGTLFDLFDVESIEVERGPQGTLLGKNAPTGAISVTSRRPTGEWGGAVEMGYERYDLRQFKLRVDAPIVEDVLALKITGVYKEGGNYIRSLTQGGKRKFGGEETYATKVGLLFTPSDNIEWLINGAFDWTKNPQGGMRDMGYLGQDGPYQGETASCLVFGHCSPSEPRTSNAGWVKDNRSNSQLISSKLDIDFEPLTLTSVTGYRHYSERNNSDVDGQPEPILDSHDNPLTYEQFSQEIRLSSNANGGLDFGGKLDWVIGGFYSHFTYSNSQTLNIFGTPLNSDENGKTKSYALFAHLVYNVTDRFNITVGARQSWDKKTHDYITVGETIRYVDDPLSFRNFSMEAGFQYRITDETQAYFRFAEGYRGGGYQSLPSPGGTQEPYDPETVKTYEIGFKGDFFDRRLRLNASAYLSDYKGLQRTVIGGLEVPPYYTQIIRNAADARVKGFELESTMVPIDGLTITGSLTYLDPKYKNFIASFVPGQPATDNSHFPFPYASKWTVKVGPQYEFELANLGRLTLSSDLTHASRYSITVVPYPAAQVRPLTIINARVKFEDMSGKYSLTLYGQNLTNKHYIANYTTQPTPPGAMSIFAIGMDSKPLVYGATLGMKF